MAAGRPSRRRHLAVWMNGELVGTWSLSAAGDHVFGYARSWLDSRYARALSLSIPLEVGTEPVTGPRVGHFFDNLLPDSTQIRQRLAQRFHTGTQTLELLEKIGRDCIGAVQLLPMSEQPTDVHTIKAQPLTQEEVEKLLVQASSSTVAWEEEDELRISLAGAQEKTALLWHENQWCRSLGATPTTHILKLPLGVVGGMRADFSTSVENEWLCAQIAREFDLPVANCHIEVFGAQKALVVERFDRRLINNTWWARLPQEDFCQVYGLPSSQKYERDKGPGMAQILKTLRGSDVAQQDRQRFLTTQLLFWLLAAPDGHAKNFSIRLEARGSYRLTPLYDILSAWPVIGKGSNQFQWQDMKLAMAVRGRDAHYHMDKIQRRHWNQAARDNGLGEDFEAVIQQVIARTPEVVERLSKQLPPGFPDKVSEPVFKGLLAQAKRLAQQA